MTKKEYGYARVFVAKYADFICTELEKQRTIKSIWKAMMQENDLDIPYATFVYQVGNLITKGNSIERHHKNNPHQQTKKQQIKQSKQLPKNKPGTFNFNAVPDDDLI